MTRTDGKGNESTAATVWLPTNVHEEISKRAEASRRSRQFIIKEAIRLYLEKD